MDVTLPGAATFATGVGVRGPLGTSKLTLLAGIIRRAPSHMTMYCSALPAPGAVLAADVLLLLMIFAGALAPSSLTSQTLQAGTHVAAISYKSGTQMFEMYEINHVVYNPHIFNIPLLILRWQVLLIARYQMI